jgi:hypothetical protein
MPDPFAAFRRGFARDLHLQAVRESKRARCSCGKAIYEGPSQCYTAMERLRRLFPGEGTPERCYQCPDERQNWHLTTSPLRESNRVEAEEIVQRREAWTARHLMLCSLRQWGVTTSPCRREFKATQRIPRWGNAVGHRRSVNRYRVKTVVVVVRGYRGERAFTRGLRRKIREAR